MLRQKFFFWNLTLDRFSTWPAPENLLKTQLSQFWIQESKFKEKKYEQRSKEHQGERTRAFGYERFTQTSLSGL